MLKKEEEHGVFDFFLYTWARNRHFSCNLEIFVVFFYLSLSLSRSFTSMDMSVYGDDDDEGNIKGVCGGLRRERDRQTDRQMSTDTEGEQGEEASQVVDVQTSGKVLLDRCVFKTA